MRAGPEEERKGISGRGPGTLKGLRVHKIMGLFGQRQKVALWLEQRVLGKELAGDENEKIEFGPNLASSARKKRS